MLPTDTVNLREYNRIYTGTNQEFGYENPFFGFTTNTIELVLLKDKMTYFHYPYTAPNMLLTKTSLVTDGAVAGSAPYYSDKIWKKMANYASTSIWGDSQPVGRQTGVWLCTWLSADQNNVATPPVWMDRWYNPGYIDSTTALFIQNPLSAMVVDIPSIMLFEAGSWYKYYHVGDTANSNFVYTLTGTNNTNLKLNLDNWSQNPVDLSPYNNTSKIENYTVDCISTNGVNSIEKPTDNCLSLNGIDQHCQTLHNSSYALTGDMTCSVWAYAEDWTNIKGSHIISKNHRGGWDIKYNNGFFNPYLMVASTSGTVAFGNTDGYIYYSKNLPANSNPIAAAFDSDLFTWVLDNGIYNGSKHLYKIDYNGDILNQIVFASGETFVDLTLDANENGWILTNAGNISGFDSQMNLLATYTTSLTGSIDVDLNNGVSAFAYSKVCFDNLNNVWGVTNNTLYKNGLAIFGTQILNVACDKDDNIWVLQGNNEFVKLTNDGTYLLSGTVGIDVTTNHRGIDFTNEYYNADQYNSYVWFTNANEQYIYKYDTNGNYITKINLILYNLNPTIKKFTSYDWNRKFNYIKYDKIPQIQTNIYLNTSTLSGDCYTLSVPVTTVSNRDWHMFTFTFNQSAIKFYMDSILRDSYSTSYDKYIYYEYENPLMIGANVGKILTLDSEFNTEYLHFQGKIDDLRIYNIALNESDIQHLYFNKINYSDLHWNMPTGERNYIEEVVRFFKFKAPGQKAQYYNINLIGLNIQDESTRELIEDIIKKTIKKVTPAYAELYRIIWK